MKDSHIGSYGVIGLICYFLLLTCLIAALPPHLAVCALLSFDAWNKFVAANLVNLLPYARKEEESKAHTVYDRMKPKEFLLAALAGICWMLILMPPLLWPAALCPLVLFFLLVALMKRKLGGYSGDCCGATFLLCELSSYAGIYLIYALTEQL